MASDGLTCEVRPAGWMLKGVNGSYPEFKNAERSGIVVVPHPKKSMGLGLVKTPQRQAGI